MGGVARADEDAYERSPNAVASGEERARWRGQLNFATGIMKQVHEVCARSVTEAACRSTQIGGSVQ